MARSTLAASAALLTFTACISARAGELLPKYAPADKPFATLLKMELSHVRSKPAPDFWALIPYYEGMRAGHSASAASAAMTLNALRQDTRYTSSDELITEESLLKSATAHAWADKISGPKPAGVNLAELGSIVESSLPLYGFRAAVVRTIPVSDSNPAAVAEVRKLLAANELADKDFLIANYMQSAFTGDPEGAVGTYSPVGAFDAARDKVLILETDRKYYEPYWVSLVTFVQGLSALKDGKTGKPAGGLIWIYQKPRASPP